MKSKLQFMLDYGVNPLWSNDEFTCQRFGYNIDNLKDLGLSDKTIELSQFVAELYWARLNPIYQVLPSFWSGEMCVFFQIKVGQLFDSILTEIGNNYDIENREVEEITQIIDIHKTNSELRQFLSDPAAYYRRNRISFSGQDEEERKKTELEFYKWNQREQIILGQ
jgi:hypothetical protein